MKRRALIIAAPDSKIPGVKADFDTYKRFLQEPLGGAWRADEIHGLWNPTRSGVLAALAALKQSDFSVVTFFGHGHFDARRRTTIAELSNNEEVTADELKTGASKHLLLMDCCRLVSKVLEKRFAEAMDQAFRSLSRDNCRILYDRRISLAVPGVYELMSCAVEQTAGESDTGGDYTQALLQAAHDWSRTKNFSQQDWLPVSEAHEAAKKATERRSGGRQSPTIHYPRSQPHIPFAVVG